MGCAESIALGGRDSRVSRLHSHQHHHQRRQQQQQQQQQRLGPHAGNGGVSNNGIFLGSSNSINKNIKNVSNVENHHRCDEDGEDSTCHQTEYNSLPSVAVLRGRRGKRWLQHQTQIINRPIVTAVTTTDNEEDGQERANDGYPPPLHHQRVASSSDDTRTDFFARSSMEDISKAVAGEGNDEDDGDDGVAAAVKRAASYYSNPLMAPSDSSHGNNTSRGSSGGGVVSWNPSTSGGRVAKQLHPAGSNNTTPIHTNRSTPGTTSSPPSGHYSLRPPLAPTPTNLITSSSPHHHHQTPLQQSTNNPPPPAVELFIPAPTDITTISRTPTPNQNNAPLGSSGRVDTGLLAAMATSFNSFRGGAAGGPISSSSHYQQKQHQQQLHQSGIMARSTNTTTTTHQEVVGGIPLVPGLPRSVLLSTNTSVSPSPLLGGGRSSSFRLSCNNTSTNNNAGAMRNGKRDKYERIRNWADTIDDETYHFITNTNEATANVTSSSSPGRIHRKASGGVIRSMSRSSVLGGGASSPHH